MYPLAVKIKCCNELWDFINQNPRVFVLFYKNDYIGNLAKIHLDDLGFEVNEQSVKIVYCNINNEICEEFQISRVPQIRIFKKGSEIKSLLGITSKIKLEEYIL